MAAADSKRCISFAPYRAVFAIRNTAGALVSGATGLDSEIILDSASPSDLASEAIEIGTSGMYYVDIAATETATFGDATLLVKSAEGVTTSMRLALEPCSESGVSQGSTSTSLQLRTGASATNDFFNGQQLEIVRGTGAGQFRTVIDYIGTTKVCTIERAWITNPDSSSVYKVWRTGGRMNTDAYLEVDVQEVDGDSTVPVAMQYMYQGAFIQTSVDDATPTTTSFNGDNTLSFTDDFYNNCLLYFVTGTNAGLARQVTDYTGATALLTCEAFPVAPANGDLFVLFGKVF